jgi:uncharacterized protein (DUF927 family)
VSARSKDFIERYVPDEADGQVQGWDFYVTTAAWREELCAGYNPQSIAAALADRNMLLVQDERHRAKAIKIPGHNKVRVYHLRAAFLEADRE